MSADWKFKPFSDFRQSIYFFPEVSDKLHGGIAQPKLSAACL